MNLSEKNILLTGGTGFLGRYIHRQLIRRGVPFNQITVPPSPHSTHLDLRCESACARAVHHQNVIIHCAGNVGGIGYNHEHPFTLASDNLEMGLNLMKAAIEEGVEKFVTVGTVCEYPKFTPVPFSENDLWNGYPEETNAPYGMAKKMLLVLGNAARSEFGFNSIHLLPVNLYGPGDNFDPNSSHVIPALIKKIWEAKLNGLPSVTCWGTGRASREFLFAEDAAEAIIMAAERYDGAEPVNIGSGMEIPIVELVRLIKNLIGYRGLIDWDTSKPDGQPRRRLNTERAQNEFGFNAKIDFEKGLKYTIDWYIEQEMKK